MDYLTKPRFNFPEAKKEEVEEPKEETAEEKAIAQERITIEKERAEEKAMAEERITIEKEPAQTSVTATTTTTVQPFTPFPVPDDAIPTTNDPAPHISTLSESLTRFKNKLPALNLSQLPSFRSHSMEDLEETPSTPHTSRPYEPDYRTEIHMESLAQDLDVKSYRPRALVKRMRQMLVGKGEFSDVLRSSGDATEFTPERFAAIIALATAFHKYGAPAFSLGMLLHYYSFSEYIYIFFLSCLVSVLLSFCLFVI
jgi:hypothetical protein